MTSESHGTHDQNILNDRANTTVSDLLPQVLIFCEVAAEKVSNLSRLLKDEDAKQIARDATLAIKTLLTELSARRATADVTEARVELAFMAANDAANGDPKLLASRKMIRAALLADLKQQAPE